MQKKLSLVAGTILDLVEALVDHPEAVVLEELEGHAVTVLEVAVRKVDYGRVAGRGGRLVTAIRHLLMCYGGAGKRRWVLELLEPDPETSADESLPLSVAPAEAVDGAARLLERLVQGLVDYPSSVLVTPARGQAVVVFEVEVAREDYRRLIGTRGQTADALRELMASVGGKAGVKFMVDVVE